jgi:hypothetical protein
MDTRFADPSTERRAQQFGAAGTLLLAFGALWLATGAAVTVWLLVFTPIKTTGAHGMVPEGYHSVLYGTYVGMMTLPSLLPLAIGWALRAGLVVAPPVAMALTVVVFLALTRTLAAVPGPLVSPATPIRVICGRHIEAPEIS